MGLFNNISKRIITKSMKSQFRMFLDSLEENSKDEQSLFAPNRETRRKNKNNLSKLLGPNEMPNEIRSAYEGGTPLQTDKQYYHFLFILIHFYSTSYLNDQLFSKEFLEPFIKGSKEANLNIKFIDYFDSNMKPKLDTVLDFKRYITSIATAYKEINTEADIDGFINSIVPSYLVMEAEGIQNAELARKSQLKFERSLEKRREKRAKEIIDAVNKKEVVPTPVKEPKPSTPIVYIESEIEKLYKQGKLEALFETIRSTHEFKVLNLTKGEYNNLIYNYTVYRIKKIIDDSLYKDLQSCIEKSNEAKMEFDKLVKQFNDMKHTEVKTSIEKIISKTLRPTSTTTNYIIFPSIDFIEEQINKFNKNDALKSITTQFEKIKIPGTKFIDLKDVGKSFSISNNKAYISYSNNTKICLFNINVCEENRKVLELNDPNTRVLLVFGIGNTNVNSDNEFLSESIRYAYDNYMLIDRISNIFSTPFTVDTLKEAQDLIDIGNSSIDRFKPIDTDNSKKKKKEKKM